MKDARAPIVKVSQFSGNTPVHNASWTLVFHGHRRLAKITGAPVDPATFNLDDGKPAAMPQAEAVEIARASLRQHVGSLADADFDVQSNLELDARTGDPVWDLRLTSKVHPEGDRHFVVDTATGAVCASHDCCERATTAIPIHALQRLGSGRARIWNASHAGATVTPTFFRALSMRSDYFTHDPDLFMYSLFAHTADSTMTWDKVCWSLLHYMADRVDSGLE